MKKIIGYEKETNGFEQELIQEELKNTLHRYYEEFCIFNLSEIKIHVRINGGNWIPLEREEGFGTSYPVYKCEVKETGVLVKYSGVCD